MSPTYRAISPYSQKTRIEGNHSKKKRERSVISAVRMIGEVIPRKKKLKAGMIATRVTRNPRKSSISRYSFPTSS
jgi:hypothetical protein